MKIELANDDVVEAIQLHAARKLDTVPANIGFVELHRHKGGRFSATCEMIADKVSGPRPIKGQDT